MNYRNIINKASMILRKNSISSASLDAEILLSESLKISREKIILNLENKLNPNQIINFEKFINRRKKKEPVSLIIGKKFFWKNEFNVNKNVLTPRFETEFLIEEILRKFKLSSSMRVLDIGLGSGCILISLLKEKKRWSGTGIDISPLAIKIAKINAKMQQVDNRIKFLNSDIDKFSLGKYDLIVSNPPYINKIEYNNLDAGVKDYEPKSALYGGLDGFRIIEKVIKKSKTILKNNGLLAMEIGIGQYYKTSELLTKNGFFISKTVRDYQKIKRCLFARKIK